MVSARCPAWAPAALVDRKLNGAWTFEEENSSVSIDWVRERLEIWRLIHAVGHGFANSQGLKSLDGCGQRQIESRIPPSL